MRTGRCPARGNRPVLHFYVRLGLTLAALLSRLCWLSRSLLTRLCWGWLCRSCRLCWFCWRFWSGPGLWLAGCFRSNLNASLLCFSGIIEAGEAEVVVMVEVAAVVALWCLSMAILAADAFLLCEWWLCNCCGTEQANECCCQHDGAI